MGIRLTQFSTELKVESLVNLCVYLSIIAISGYLGEIYCCLKFIREEFKNKMNYFCRIFREWGGEAHWARDPREVILKSQI